MGRLREAHLAFQAREVFVPDAAWDIAIADSKPGRKHQLLEPPDPQLLVVAAVLFECSNSVVTIRQAKRKNALDAWRPAERQQVEEKGAQDIAGTEDEP